MQAFSVELDNLPEHIREFLLSAEYFEFLFSLHETYRLSDEQDAELVKLIADLYEKRLAVEALQDAILSRVKCDDETTKKLIKDIFVNIILPLGDHFGDWQEYFFSTVGTQDDVNASKTLPVILRLQQEIIAPRLRALETVDYDQEALNVKKIFREQIVDLHASPDDNYKIALNGLIFDLLAKKSGYHLELIGEMLDNNEKIGEEKIMRDGVRYEPFATEWIRDLHAFSSPDEVTSLSIAKYVSQSPNARKLSEKDRETLKRLFETYYTLRHFPDSLTKIPPEQWMIIPYDPATIPGGVAAPTFPPDEVLNGAQPSKSLISQLLVSKTLPQKVAAVSAIPPVIPNPKGEESREGSANPSGSLTNVRDEVKAQPSEKEDTAKSVGILPPSRELRLNTQARDDVKIQPSEPLSADRLASGSVAPVPAHGIPDRSAAPSAGNDSGTVVAPQNEMQEAPLKAKQSPMPPQDYDKTAGDIIAQCGFTLSPDIALRLKSVIITRLRNVRNDTQTKLRLMDKVEEGGIGLSSQDAEMVLDAIKQSVSPSFAEPSASLSSRRESSRSGTKADEDAGSREGSAKQASREASKSEEALQPTGSLTTVRDDVKTQPPALSIKEDENGVPVITEQPQQLPPKKEDSAKPVGIPPGGAGQADKARNESVSDGLASQLGGTATPSRDSRLRGNDSISVSPPAMKGAQKIPVQIRPGATVGKVPISDVKAPPRLLDAVGELRAMTLKDFRRLSPNPVEAAAKVTAKIQLLEKDSYTKKMAGIEAWKENEVSQLYREIGKESFGAGLKVGDVIEKRKSEGKQYLTQDEFEALLDLNENLRV